MNQTQHLNLKNIVEEIQHLIPYLETDEFEDLETYFLIKNNIQKIIEKNNSISKGFRRRKMRPYLIQLLTQLQDEIFRIENNSKNNPNIITLQTQINTLIMQTLKNLNKK